MTRGKVCFRCGEESSAEGEVCSSCGERALVTVAELIDLVNDLYLHGQILVEQDEEGGNYLVFQQGE